MAWTCFYVQKFSSDAIEFGLIFGLLSSKSLLCHPGSATFAYVFMLSLPSFTKKKLKIKLFTNSWLLMPGNALFCHAGFYREL